MADLIKVQLYMCMYIANYLKKKSKFDYAILNTDDNVLCIELTVCVANC